MFDTVLIANRGEIACRIIRTLRRLGVRSAVVYTDPDEASRHVAEADVAVRVGDYLDIGAVVAAARRARAQAVHPGYGFLAENARFAAAVEAAGLVFVGPPGAAIELMGDKIRAKQTVAAYGVPVVPGSSGSGLTDAQLADEARKVGLPVLLKPSAGGGGKGMHLVRDEARLADEIAAARREAAGAFGDDTLLVERWIDRPRHIEIQVLADAHGNVVHLGERECSLQRRHQKIIEEAPSVLLDDATRAAMGHAAVEAARSCGYVGAGTVEFIVPGDAHEPYFMELTSTSDQMDRSPRRSPAEFPVSPPTAPGTSPSRGLTSAPQADTASPAAGSEASRVSEAAQSPDWVNPVPAWFGFMEMNTRLQVEHPVTELVTGVDLVEWQLRIAAGEPLGFSQSDVRLTGHAVEARVYAEDPARGFLPSGGPVLALREPVGDGVRVDSGLVEGYEVGSAYDPMLAKVIAHGPDRDTALHRLRAALERTAVLGVRTNTRFLTRLLAHEDVVAGRLDTGLVEAALDDLVAAGEPPHAVAATAGLLAQAELEPVADGGWSDPFSVPSGWRLGEHAATVHRFRVDGGEPVEVRVRGRGPHTEVAYEGGEMTPMHVHAENGAVRVTHDGLTETYLHAVAPDGGRWLAYGADTWRVVPYDPVESAAGAAGSAGDGTLLAPMPGTVTVVKAAVGDRVTAGQAVVVVEAMKMEHAVTAPFDGTLSELRVTAGTRVALDELLALVHPDGEADGAEHPQQNQETEVTP